MSRWLFLVSVGAGIFCTYLVVGCVLGGLRCDVRKRLCEDMERLAGDCFYHGIDLRIPDDCWYYIFTPLWMGVYLWPITVFWHVRAVKRCRARVLAAAEAKLLLLSPHPELVKKGGFPLPEDWSPRGELP